MTKAWLGTWWNAIKSESLRTTPRAIWSVQSVVSFLLAKQCITACRPTKSSKVRFIIKDIASACIWEKLAIRYKYDRPKTNWSKPIAKKILRRRARRLWQRAFFFCLPLAIALTLLWRHHKWWKASRSGWTSKFKITKNNSAILIWLHRKFKVRFSGLILRVKTKRFLKNCIIYIFSNVLIKLCIPALRLICRGGWMSIIIQNSGRGTPRRAGRSNWYIHGGLKTDRMLQKRRRW